ncbi:MAG TPA: hypothetical protein ENK83_02225 [Aliiroseovarius sp.]|nr:hypothetical protein [Aliiroseovarius sp.]
MDLIEAMRAEAQVYTFDDVEAAFAARGFAAHQERISRTACICDAAKRDFMVILNETDNGTGTGTGTE